MVKALEVVSSGPLSDRDKAMNTPKPTTGDMTEVPNAIAG